MTTLTTSYLQSPLSSLPPSPLKLFSFTHSTTNNIRIDRKRKFDNITHNYNPENILDPLPSLLINYQSKYKKVKKEDIDELEKDMFNMTINEKDDIIMEGEKEDRKEDGKKDEKDDLIKKFVEFIGNDKIKEFIETYMKREKDNKDEKEKDEKDENNNELNELYY